jgi:hypothetical protein
MSEPIQHCLSREEVQERFKQEALAPYTAYQEFGQHLTGKEARRSLRGKTILNEQRRCNISPFTRQHVIRSASRRRIHHLETNSRL